ncbi:ATP-binding protein [Nannocystaceae bacterium ST9]
MSLAVQLRPEWERVGLLASCVSCLRRGEALSDELRGALADSQREVGRLREGEAWQSLVESLGLDPLAQDVLVCLAAADAEPGLGWAFQELQGGSAASYPSPALLRELLALDEGESAHLHRSLASDAPLRRLGLLECPSEQPFDPLRPTAKTRALLLGWPSESNGPPGTAELPVPVGLDFDALILPRHHRRSLQEFVAWIRQRRRLIDDWGADIGGGPVALLAGPSGTGKTFAATVVASVLGWRLFRVDLGMLVSKWLGETEKNLNRLFDAAIDQPLILLFDEADSLFGKRGEVREARDRYANMEVSHLLARLERHRGPAILTTNLREHLDLAFARRLQIVVEFPLPDLDARAELWRRYLPPKAPRERSVEPMLLARASTLSGAQIRNCCLYASVLALANDKPIGLAEVARAVWVELGKAGHELMPSSLGPLAAHLGEDAA